jgi:CDP-diglyceride synthetase
MGLTFTIWLSIGIIFSSILLVLNMNEQLHIMKGPKLLFTFLLSIPISFILFIILLITKFGMKRSFPSVRFLLVLFIAILTNGTIYYFILENETEVYIVLMSSVIFTLFLFFQPITGVSSSVLEDFNLIQTSHEKTLLSSNSL